MRWLSFLQKDVSKEALDKTDVRPAPVDPTLEAAAIETSMRIRERAKQIDVLSQEILGMTDGLLLQLKASPNEKHRR